MNPWWEIDNAAIIAARALWGQQPRADATIIQLPTGGPGLVTDIIPVWRNGQTYAVSLGSLPIVNGFIGAASQQTQLGFYSVKDVNVFGTNSYQATGNGVTDDTLALQGIMQSMPAHAVMYFPPGSYKTSATLTMTVPIYMVGQGRFAVVLACSTAGFAIQANGVYGFGISGMRINNQIGGCFGGFGPNAIVGGVCQQSYALCGDFVCRDVYFTCPASGQDAVLLNNFQSAYFETTNWSTGAGTRALHLTGCGIATAAGKPKNGVSLGYTLEIHLTDCVLGGALSAADTTSAGLYIDGYTDGIYTENLDILGFAHSIAIVPNTQTATYTDVGAVVNTYTFNGFAGDFYMSNSTPNTSASANLFVQPQDATSVVNDLSFSNTQIAGADVNSGSDGVFLDASLHVGSVVSGVLFSNCGVGQNGLSGIRMRGVSNVTFLGGYITSNQRYNTGGGWQIILDAAASTNINFIGVNCSIPFNQSFPAGYACGGLNVGPFAHVNLNFRDCNFTGTSTPLSNQLLIAQKVTGNLQIRNCAGITPAGPGGSATYLSAFASGTACNNISPFDIAVYISGGTAVTINANGAATGLTSGAFALPPGGPLLLTYTASPAVTTAAF